ELLQKNTITSFSEFEHNLARETEQDFQEEITALKYDYEKRIQELQNEIQSLKSDGRNQIAKEVFEINNKEPQQIENNQSYLNTIDYSKFSLAELKSIGKLLGIGGLSKYKKGNTEDLVLLIKNNKT